MKAHEFVKKFGWEYAIEIVKNQPEKNGQMFRHYDNKYSNEFTVKKAVSVIFLKRLVESYELVQSRGGLPMVKADMLFLDAYEKESPYWVKMADAIKDVESCL